MAGDDLATAREYLDQLRSLAFVGDADGAHPLTLSLVRLADRYLAREPPDSWEPDSTAVARGRQLAAEWSDAVLRGEWPVTAGTRLASRHLRAALQRHKWWWDMSGLVEALDAVEQRTDLIAVYRRLLETAIAAGDRTFLCGADEVGRTYFAELRPNDNGSSLGLLFDLPALSELLMSSAVGSELGVSGFAAELFDVDATSEFERRYRDAVQAVAPVSSAVYRLHAGIYSRDEPLVFSHYRNRNLLVVVGIAVLAGSMVLGAYVLVRETGREVQTARLRSEFVANVSHELRTPLTSIRMFAETLLLGRYRSEQQRDEYLTTVMRESQRLSRMVGNILDFSRMESGRKTYDFAPADLGGVVASTLEEFEPLLHEQGFEVAVAFDENLPAVKMDAEAMETVVANLLSNAVKYSADRKEVEIAVRASASEAVVEVADRGIGVPEDQRGRIFDKYERARNAAATATGTGLGLALVAGIVDSHKGAVTVEARAGGGSLFRVALPLTRES